MKMLEAWKTKEFRDSQERNKNNRVKNRDSSQCHYRGGAWSVGKIRKKMEDELKREVAEIELYKRCWGTKDETLPTQASQKRAEELENTMKMWYGHRMGQMPPLHLVIGNLLMHMVGLTEREELLALVPKDGQPKCYCRNSSSKSNSSNIPSDKYVPMELFQQQHEEMTKLKAEQEELLERVKTEQEEQLKKMKAEQEAQIKKMQLQFDVLSKAFLHFRNPSFNTEWEECQALNTSQGPLLQLSETGKHYGTSQSHLLDGDDDETQLASN